MTVALDLSVQTVLLVLAAAALAVVAAASELIGRFRDEPLRVVGSRPGLVYLLLNALLAAVVLIALRYVSPPATAIAALEQVLLAGFGARILVRTKIIAARGKDGTTEETGPGLFFERLLGSISRTADRGRAADRLKLVATLLEGVTWEHARTFFLAELAGAMQDLTAQEKTAIQTNFEAMSTQAGLDDATRVNLLGYLVLDYGGETFLRELASLYRKRFPVVPAGTPAAP